MMKRLIFVLAFIVGTLGYAFGQSGQLPSGYVWGNPTASQAPGQPASLTAMFDQGFCSTSGSILTRGASVWACSSTLPSGGFANPTATVGLSAVNGSATTAMRSDAAPALSAAVQSALTGTNHAVALGTGAFGFGSAGPCAAGTMLGGNGSSIDPTCKDSSGLNYTAPFTGGSAITQQAYNAERVSIFEFKATTDPSNASDNATALTNALATAKCVFFPWVASGYSFAANTFTATSDTCIIGENQVKLISNVAASNAFLYLTPQTSINPTIVDNVTIDMTGAGSTATVTITIASPGVVTWTGHGLTAGATVFLTTTGALPTGLTTGVTYYVINPTANTFQLATTPGGSAINTSGTQSGTHTGHTIPTAVRLGTATVAAVGPVVFSNSKCSNAVECVGDEYSASNFSNYITLNNVRMYGQRGRQIYLRRTRGFIQSNGIDIPLAGTEQWESARYEDFIGLEFNRFDIYGGNTSGVYSNHYALAVQGLGSGSGNASVWAYRVLIDNTQHSGMLFQGFLNPHFNTVEGRNNLGNQIDSTDLVGGQMTQITGVGAVGVTGAVAGANGLTCGSCVSIIGTGIYTQLNTGNGFVLQNSTDNNFAGAISLSNTGAGIIETGTSNRNTITDVTTASNGTNVTLIGALSSQNFGLASGAVVPLKSQWLSGSYTGITGVGTLTAGAIGAGFTAIPISALANSTISGVALGGNLANLTGGTHFTNSAYNGSSAITLNLDATNANTASTIIARDASGNFSATSITLSGPLAVPTGSAAAPALNFGGSAITGIYSPAASFVTLAYNSNLVAGMDAGVRFTIYNGQALTFDAGGGSGDTGIARSGAAGLLEVNSGAVGTFRDIRVRDAYTGNATFLIRTKTALTNGGAAATATLTNAPVAGNPTKWIAIDDNGTTRQIPAW